MSVYPRLKMVEWIEKNEVRLFFSTGKIVEIKLPVKNAKHAHIVDQGLGLDPGDGKEISAPDLARHPSGIVLCEGRKTRYRGRLAS